MIFTYRGVELAGYIYIYIYVVRELVQSISPEGIDGF